MALIDDKKKKPYEPGVLPGAKLIPGSTAETIANAVGGFKANYNAKLQTGEQNRLANNLNFVNPADPASMIARPSNRGLTAAPAARPVAQPTVAAPGASSTQARATAGGVPAPRTAAQLNQASQAEINARTSTPSPASMTQGAGASTSVGAVAAPPRRATMRPDGVAVVKMADGTNAYGANGRSVANAQGTMTSVNQQNFGTAAVPQASGGIARPPVASTFGQSVLSMPDDNVIAAPPAGAVRGPDAMAEQYNSREDREAAKKLAGDMDTDLFRLSFKAGQGGRNGRAAMEAMGAIRGKQSEIAGGLNKLASDATQGRADRDNQFGISEMEQRAAERRAMLDADVTREGQQLGFQSDIYKTSADIARPDIKQDAAGNYVNLAGGVARPVLDANGKPVQGARQQVDTGAVQPKDALAAVNKELASLVNNPPDMTMGGDVDGYNARVAELRAQQAAYLGGGQQQAAVQTATNPKAGERMRLNPQTQQWEPLK